jgi:nucleotidyltransferase/DNA polymerase involved in DNA repair
MQQANFPPTNPPATEQVTEQPGTEQIEAALAVARAHLRQGIMYVQIQHFYATLEEMFDPALHGISFVVGTGTGRPNEPGRVMDVSPLAKKLGIVPGMPLRRAHRIAPRTRFMAASYERYQPIQQKLRELYKSYSRIVESLSPADAFIDLRGSEKSFDSPVDPAQQLCAAIAEIGLTAQIGVANGKAIAELAALMSRKDGRQGVLYIPPGREASFVQTLPLSLLLQVRMTGAGTPGSFPELAADEGRPSQPPEIVGKSEQSDPVAVAEMLAHLRDFGVTSFAQVASLTQEGLARRLGRLGRWLFQVAQGQDSSLVVPDAPPLSQNARVRFHHPADADETCAAIQKLADYLGTRLREQRLRGQTIALILWPNSGPRETRKLLMNEEGEGEGLTAAEETLGGQMVLSRHTDEADVIAHHGLMLFAHYHRAAYRYLQVQLRIGDMLSAVPVNNYPQAVPSRSRFTRKL